MKIKSLNRTILLCLVSGANLAMAADATPAAASATSAPAPAAATATSTTAPATTASAAASGSATAAASASAPARGRGTRGGTMTPAEVAAVAKLMDLSFYAPGVGDGSYSIGPTFTPAPEQTVRTDVPKGKVVQFTMNAADSKFYPPAGLRGTTPTRAVTVYIPSQYVPGTPAALIVSHDAMGSKNNQLPTILDNMIADHRLPVIVAVMINHGGGDGPGSERGLEYDTVSGKYAEFIEAEVLPRITKDYNVTFTKDPDARMTMGGSSGGSCALSMAWFHPELYHRVLTYSGTYVNQQAGPDAPHGAWNFHETLIPNSPVKPLRIWMEAGQNDNGSTAPGSGFHNWLLANMNMATVLKAKDYHFQFVYAKGGKHVDGGAVAQTLPQALEYVWKGYPIEPAKDTKAAPAATMAPSATTTPAAVPLP